MTSPSLVQGEREAFEDWAVNNLYAVRTDAGRLKWNSPAYEAIARAALSSSTVQQVGAEWQPIETAPKDGREVLLMVELRAGVPGKSLVGHYMQGGHCIEDHPPVAAGWYFWNGSRFDVAAKPTRWMPIPAGPKSDGGMG